MQVAVVTRVSVNITKKDSSVKAPTPLWATLLPAHERDDSVPFSHQLALSAGTPVKVWLVVEESSGAALERLTGFEDWPRKAVLLPAIGDLWDLSEPRLFDQEKAAHLMFGFSDDEAEHPRRPRAHSTTSSQCGLWNAPCRNNDVLNSWEAIRSQKFPDSNPLCD